MDEQEQIIGKEKAAQKADALIGEVLAGLKELKEINNGVETAGPKPTGYDPVVGKIGEMLIRKLEAGMDTPPWFCRRALTGRDDVIRLAKCAASSYLALQMAQMAILAVGVRDATGKMPRLPFNEEGLAEIITRALADMQRD